MSPRARRMPTPAARTCSRHARLTASTSAGTSIGSRYSARRSSVRPRAVSDPACERYSARYSGTNTKPCPSSESRAKNSISGVLMSGRNLRRRTALVRTTLADMGTLFRQTAAAALASTSRGESIAPVLVRDVVRGVDEAAARPVDDVSDSRRPRRLRSSSRKAGARQTGAAAGRRHR